MTGYRATGVRLLATDLDGTLLHSDNTVSDATRDAVAAAGAAGLEVVFVTGRPTRWLWEVAEALGFTGTAVAANGALTYDLASETVVHTQSIEAEVLAAATQRLRQEFPDVVFAVEADDAFVFEHGYVHDWEVTTVLDHQGNRVPLPEPSDLSALLAQTGVIKLLAKDRGAHPEEFMAAAVAALGGSVSVTRSSKSGLIEISAAGVSKASGLARHCQLRGVTAEQVVAVGDMPNDIPMLEWAGHGYAVANAYESVHRAADGVLPWTNDQDAVARVLTGLLAGALPDVQPR